MSSNQDLLTRKGPEKTLWGTALPKRAVDEYEKDDPTLNIPKRNIDAVLVFDIAPRDDVGLDSSTDRIETSHSYDQRLRVLKSLHASGLQLTQSLSLDQTQWIIRISAPNELLETYAERMGKKFKTRLFNTQEEMNRGLLNGFAEFRIDKKTQYAMIMTGQFMSVERQRILLYIIEKSLGGDGESMKMIKEAENTKLFHLFPTHDPDCQADLNRLWVESYREIAPSNQVLDLVRDYYGEEISIYFAFLGSYTRWLVSISLLGLLVKISQLQYGVDSVLVPVYCVAVALWSILFLECWKREQAELQLRWNVRDFEDTEVDRIDFYGEIRVSPITGEDEMYFSDEQRLWKYAVTGPIMLLSMGAVVVAAIGVVIFQYFSVHSGTFGPYGSLVSGVVNAIVIQVMNKIYESLAYKMNNYENHQSQTDYDDALILKVFVFQFVNSYAAVVYMAFLAGRFTVFGINLKCTKHGCLSDIHNLIFATLMLNIITGNLIEVAVPYATFKIEEYNNLKARSEDIGGGQMQADETSPLVSVINAINPFYDEDDEMLSRRHDEFVLPPIMSKHELEAHMPTYETTFSDYNELVIQFGYIVLFSMALPIGSLLCLINNLIEIRSDAFKLVNVFQRPFYRGAQDIGQWGLILRVMVVMGVLFNCGMMAFTSNIFLRDGWVDPSTVGVVEMLAAVFVGEHLLLMIMVICADFIPDERATLTDDEERLQEKADDVLRTKDDVDRSREKARVYREMKQLIDEHDVALLEDIQIRKWRRTKQYGTGLLSTVDPPEVQDGEKHGKPAEWLEKRERQEHRTEELKAKLFEYDLY